MRDYRLQQSADRKMREAAELLEQAAEIYKRNTSGPEDHAERGAGFIAGESAAVVRKTIELIKRDRERLAEPASPGPEPAWLLTQDEAIAEAQARWGRGGFAHNAYRRPVAERYEVGNTRGGLPVVLGRGASWREAFTDASRREIRREGPHGA